MVCFRYIIVNTQHKGNNKNKDNKNNNNMVAAIKIPISGKHHSATILLPSCFQTLKNPQISNFRLAYFFPGQTLQI